MMVKKGAAGQFMRLFQPFLFADCKSQGLPLKSVDNSAGGRFDGSAAARIML